MISKVSGIKEWADILFIIHWSDTPTTTRVFRVLREDNKQDNKHGGLHGVWAPI